MHVEICEAETLRRWKNTFYSIWLRLLCASKLCTAKLHADQQTAILERRAAKLMAAFWRSQMFLKLSEWTFVIGRTKTRLQAGLNLPDGRAAGWGGWGGEGSHACMQKALKVAAINLYIHSLHFNFWNTKDQDKFNLRYATIGRCFVLV